MCDLETRTICYVHNGDQIFEHPYPNRILKHHTLLWEAMYHSIGSLLPMHSTCPPKKPFQKYKGAVAY